MDETFHSWLHRSIVLYSDGTHYFEGYRRAAKQGQPTGMRPYGNLVLQCLTGSSNVIWSSREIHLEACVHTHTHTSTHTDCTHLHSSILLM